MNGYNADKNTQVPSYSAYLQWRRDVGEGTEGVGGRSGRHLTAGGI